MHISVISLLFFAVVFGACQSRDQRQFLRDLEKRIRDELVVEEFDQFIDGFDKQESCSCANNSCSCCINVQLMSTMKVCGIVAFEQDTSVNFSLTVNGGVLLTVQIKGDHPPSLCKELAKGFKVCITFDKVSIDLKAHKFYGCVELQIKKGPLLVKKFKIGCFQLPPPKSNYRSSENKFIAF